MNNKKKPSWFRLQDLFAMAGVGLAIAGITTYALITGVEGPHATQGIVLCYIVAALFIAIWGRYCQKRYQWLDTFKWYPKHGFMVYPENYHLPDDKEFDGLVEETTNKWATYYNANHVINETDDIFWVFMKKNLDESAQNRANMKVNGLTIAYSHTIMVDYDLPDDKLVKTAFEHELGHIIMGQATSGWDLETHHKFMAAHKLR